jgi:hypothetical protein
MAERPNKDATRLEWDAYASTLDLDPEEYPNKEALIEAVDAAEEADAADPDDVEPEDDTPAADAVDVPEKGQYPEGREKASKSWKAAYDHAVAHGNPEKTATLYADQHFQDEEFGG